MNRWLKIAAISFLALVAQTAFLKGIKPDFILVLLVFYTLEHGPEFGAVYGFAAGVCMDLLGGGILGSNAFAKTLIGTGVGTLQEFVFPENFILKVLLVFAASLSHDLLVYFIQFIMHPEIGSRSFTLIILPAAFYNTFIALLFSLYSLWVRKR